MDYTIEPKPTFYGGQMFRSRLEATWACFFDFLGWTWKYEPCRFEKWTPDFVLRRCGGQGKDIYCEVKPVELHYEFGASPDDFNLGRLVEIVRSGLGDPVMLLGLHPIDDKSEKCAVGHILDFDYKHWKPAEIAFGDNGFTVYPAKYPGESPANIAEENRILKNMSQLWDQVDKCVKNATTPMEDTLCRSNLWDELEGGVEKRRQQLPKVHYVQG